MVQWIIENFGIIGHIADHKGNLPIHFAAAGGRLVSLTHWITHPLTHSLTHWPTHLLTHWITHSLTHSLTHSHTYLSIPSGSVAIIKYLVQQYGKEYTEKKDKSQTAPVYYAAQDGQ